jgi:hypothetical protein
MWVTLTFPLVAMLIVLGLARVEDWAVPRRFRSGPRRRSAENGPAAAADER